MDEFVARLRTTSVALAIEGDPGIGKTTLWQQALARGRAAGMRVLACRPASAEAKLSFSGLSDMLSVVGADALTGLPEPQRLALEVALLRSAPDSPALDPRLVGTALLSLVRTLAAAGGVILAVDDAQWLDAPTSSVLAFAARRLDSEPAGVVVAHRTGAGGLELLESLDRERVVRLRLGPLAPDSLRRLIARHMPRPLPSTLLGRIADASGGNPFYALEVARLLPEDETGVEAAAVPVPEDVRSLARSRVEALPTDTRAALLRAAVLAAPEIRVVDPDALAPAEDVGLVRIDPRGRIEFTHPLFAAAIYSSASAADRRAAHRSVAAELTDPEERARHLAYATARPDAEVAAELDAAAELACSRGAAGAAAELVELALLRTPPGAGEQRLARLGRAASLHRDAGDLQRANELVTALLSQPAPERLRAHALRLRATLESHSDSFPVALQTTTEALEAAGGEPSVAAAIELDVAFYWVAMGEVDTALRHAEAAVGRAELGGDPGVLADALAVVTMVGFLAGDGLSQERLERALALEEPDRQRALFSSPRYVAGLMQLWTGQLRAAVHTLQQLRGERSDRGAESDMPAFSLYLVWAYLWLGELDHAAEVADADAAVARLLQDRWLIALVQSACALVSAHRGDVEKTRTQAEQALEHFSQLEWHTGMVWPRWALGFAELSAGRPAAAHEAMAPLTESLPATGLADPIGLVFLPDEIEALIALGELTRAEALIELLDRLGRAHDRAWATAAAARGRGLLLTARGELDAAIDALDRALAEHERVEMPVERARTLLALGRARRRRKKWGPAREALRQALGLFERTGSPLWAEAARAELARAGERPGDPTELTPTERRVAELAASGLTNQEVAERAFLTVKGVEANLTRAYRKLGIRSRAGLPAALGGDDEAVTPR